MLEKGSAPCRSLAHFPPETPHRHIEHLSTSHPKSSLDLVVYILTYTTMAEVQYAKSFLGLLESRPIKYSSDYVADPRTLPAQSVVYT